MTIVPRLGALIHMCLLLFTLASFASAQSPAGEPVRYILDTDIASDCDDAGAVAMVNALLDRKEVNVLAMMVSTGGPYGAPALSAINAWYGHQDIPIGTLKDPRFWVGGSMNAPANAYNYESYNHHLAVSSPVSIKSGEEAPDATTLYRKILAAQPDNSVVINTIGPLPNLYHLMHSKPDEHSPASGMDLIRAKVKTLVITGGRNPEGTSSNFSKANAGIYTRPVIENWPSPIVFVGNEVGGQIMTSWSRNSENTRDNPARAAYGRFHRGDDMAKHHTSDQAGVLYAIRGNGSIYTLVDIGHQTCDDKGMTRWDDSPSPTQRHAYVRKLENADALIAPEVEEIMTQSRSPVSAK